MDNGVFWLISAICVDGVIIGANILQLTLLFKFWRGRQKPVEVVVWSLCVSDLMSGVVAFTEDSIQLSSMLHINEVDETAVQAYLFDSMFTFSILLSNLHVISIAIKKLVAEIAPPCYKRIDSNLHRIINICAVWLLASIMAPIISIVPDIYAKKAILGFSFVQRAYGFVFLVACCIVFFVYSSLFFVLVTRERKRRATIGVGQLEMRCGVRNRRNTYMCLLLGLSFLACVLPYSLGLLDARLYHPFWNILVVLNHLLNPLVYFARFFLDSRQTANDKKLLIGMDDVDAAGNINEAYDAKLDCVL